MDEEAVRSHAEAHTRAVIAGDMDRGSLDLLDECLPQAIEVMKRMPQKVVRAEVEFVEPQGDEWRVCILYCGDDDARIRVESLWVEQAGRPMIRAARVIDEDR